MAFIVHFLPFLAIYVFRLKYCNEVKYNSLQFKQIWLYVLNNKINFVE